MDKKHTLELLNRFVDRDRNTLKSPWVHRLNSKNYYCASDAYNIVMIPTNADNEINEEDLAEPLKHPNLDNLIPNFDLKHVINFAALKKSYIDIPMVMQPVIIECDACEGSGQFEHYDQYYDCKSCNETGKYKTGREEKIKDPNYAFRAGEAVFMPNKLNSVLNTFWMVNNNVDPININICGKKTTVLWFTFNDVYFAISSKCMDDDEENLPTKFIDILNLSYEPI